MALKWRDLSSPLHSGRRLSMEISGFIFLASLVLGAVLFMLGFSVGFAKAERRTRIYRRIWGV
jgi:hypothetical protein